MPTRAAGSRYWQRHVAHMRDAKRAAAADQDLDGCSEGTEEDGEDEDGEHAEDGDDSVDCSEEECAPPRASVVRPQRSVPAVNYRGADEEEDLDGEAADDESVNYNGADGESDNESDDDEDTPPRRRPAPGPRAQVVQSDDESDDNEDAPPDEDPPPFVLSR